MHRSFVLKCVSRDEDFFNKRSVESEYLEPVVRAVSNVDQIIVRHEHGMNGVIETFWRRSLNQLRARRKRQLIVRLLTVRSPVPLVRAGIRVKNDDAVIEVSVCHEQFIRLRVHEQASRSSQVRSIVAALILSRVTDLYEEFPFARELQDLVVFFSVSA